jgi:hypothetical protein
MKDIIFGIMPFVVIALIVWLITRKFFSKKSENVSYINPEETVVIGSRSNKVVRVALSGGLVGLLGTNPAYAIENVISVWNDKGYHCRQILPHETRNLIAKLFQILVLIMTIGIWTFGAGYILLLEKIPLPENLEE